MNLESEPSRFRESNFRRFEPTIIAILERWPQKSVFKPISLSVETFGARLRDAVTAYLRLDCLWESIIDRDKLREVWQKKHVKLVGPTVVVCLKSSNRTPTNVVYETGESGQQELKEFIINKCEIEHLHAIARLLNDQKVDIPFRIVNSKFGEQDFVLLQDTFPNIQYAQVPDGYLLL